MVDDAELGAIIARAIFKAGDWNGMECHRIQFMVGGYGKSERAAAGFAEQPLADLIQKVLKEHRSY
jgi:hypothetical protein